MPSKEHETELERYLKELEEKGYKTVNLHGKMPDGIAIKNGRIFAVEILGKQKTERKNYDSKTHHGRYVTRFYGGITLTQKRNNYRMFDEVLFSFFWKSSQKEFPDGRKNRIKNMKWERRKKNLTSQTRQELEMKGFINNSLE